MWAGTIKELSLRQFEQIVRREVLDKLLLVFRVLRGALKSVPEAKGIPIMEVLAVLAHG